MVVLQTKCCITIPPYRIMSPFPRNSIFWEGTCMTTHVKALKPKHIFFCHLIAGCLTCALCCYLQASTFIPTQACHVLKPPPRWFRSCPFLSSFYPKASVGDRIILRVVINCISYFLLFHLRCASCAVCWAPFLWDSERRQQLARARETRALMMNKSRKH